MRSPKAPPLNLEVLHAHLPLDTPMTVLVDPANACNFKCTFCPTGNPNLLKSVSRPLGVMKFDLYTRIIDSLAEFPRQIKSLYLHKDGEPLLNKSLGGMVAYAKGKGVAQAVWVTTNGALLTKDRAVELIESGLDAIRVSVEHVHEQGYLQITQNYSNYQRVRDNVAALYEEKVRRGSPLAVYTKIVDAGLTEVEKKEFIDAFSPICDYLNIDALMGWSNTGEADMMLGQDPGLAMDGVTPLRRGRRVCPSPFKNLAVNFNGQVSVCCVDWSLGTIVGDASRERLVDIWNGEPMRRFRLTHLRGERESIPACDGCQYVLGYTPESDLDAIAESILPIFSR